MQTKHSGKGKMGKALVIVESPAKAKSISKYLSKDYIVKPSIGHIRDLPTSTLANKKNYNSNTSKKKKDKHYSKLTLINRMGIDPYHDWQAQYEILPGKEKVVNELKVLAEKADHIYLATDLDREGEAIAWHLREIIGGDDTRFSRIVFNEITKNAITQAFKNPEKLNINKVYAQQARRFMDRIVGYMVSPLLWKKIARGLSAGRVQSVAVRLLVERERAIKTFTPEEYWELKADIETTKSASFTMQVIEQQGKLFKPANHKQIQEALEILKNTKYVVSSYKNKPTSSKPKPPFTTSTLQQAANRRLGYGINKTMRLAQHLYESGYITYMRTDSTNISRDALDMVRNYINDSFSSSYLPSAANEYISKNNSQEAHEAIRPSCINILPEQLKYTEIDGQKLYQIIWRQFVACQMTPAKYEHTSIIVTAGEFKLRAQGKKLSFDGWTKIIQPLRHGEDNQILPELKTGEKLKLIKLFSSQHFSKAPARYNEASLVKELEKLGIGRPSTYASIIYTIQNRGYVYSTNKRFYASKIGEIVTDRLEKNFSELMNYDFTAKMENTLDQIAANQQEWKNVLNMFFQTFSQQLKKAEQDPEEGGMRPNKTVTTNIDCLICGRKMRIRTASTGVFLSCSGYTLASKEQCKNTINLIPESEILNSIKNQDEETNALLARHRCEKCNTAMDSYIINKHNKLHICGNNPICDGHNLEKGKFSIQGHDSSEDTLCHKCGSSMDLKLGRFGKYMSCSNDKCKNTQKILHNDNANQINNTSIPMPELKCEDSSAYLILKNGITGIFLAANTFPKYRYTRSPLVAELARFRDRLPENLRYLTDAPVKDDEGNSTIVRFSRKSQQQYVTSEKNGKSTGWVAFYIDNQWQTIKK